MLRRVYAAALCVAAAGCAGDSAGLEEAAVATIVVAPATVTVYTGATSQLAASVLDASGAALSGHTVTWTSSNPAVASVSASGLVSGVAAGAVTVMASSEGRSGSALVTVLAPVATINVEPATVSLAPGATSQLTATLKDAAGTVLSGRDVAWTSSNNAVASVSNTGLVTGVAAGGPVAITAASEGRSGSAQVTVLRAPVASVTVEPANVTLAPGATFLVVATPRDAAGNALSGRVVEWSSGNFAVARVSSIGLVTAIAVGGPVGIVATCEGVSGVAQVTVRVPVASVTVDPATIKLAPGATSQLTATPKDADGNTLAGRAVTWGSGNSGVASVSAAGLVTGVSDGGPVTITATSEGVSGSAQVTVQATVASVTVEPASLTLAPGGSFRLMATPRDAAGNALLGRDVAWSSASHLVVWVDEIGVVHAVAAGGPVAIMAYCEGVTGVAQVTVQVPVGSVTMQR